MENYYTTESSDSHEYKKNDSYLECAAYMKTKQYLGNRIFEQQVEIEKLKSQLFYQTIKNNQYLDWIRHYELLLRKSSKQDLIYFRYSKNEKWE